ncbi:MAG: TonB-dependent siderophore receptor [Paracoccaceae bacterium]
MHTEINAFRHRIHRNRYMTGLLLGCASFAVVPSGACAQETATDVAQEPDGAFRLSPILVDYGVQEGDADSVVARELWVGGKVATSVLDTPASVSVITEKEIKQRNAETVEDVLNYTPGIITDYFGTDDRNDYYLVRGFQASTYRDGLTLGSMRGVREEPYAYERVEVLKGANSTLFGASDPGGSVNFVTKAPRFERFGEAYAQGGSFEHLEGGVDFGGTLGANSTLAYRFTGKLQNSNLEYATSRDNEVFLMGGLTWAPTDRTSLTVIVDHLDRDSTPNSGGYPMDQDYDRELFFGEPEFNDHDVERSTVTAMLEHNFGGGLSARGNLRYSDLTDDFGYVYLFDFAGRTGTVLDRFQFGTDSSAEELIGNAMVQYDASFGVVDSSTLVGFEYRDASTSETSFFGGAGQIDIANPVFSGAPAGVAPYLERDSDFKTRSLFVQQNFSFYDRLIATVGLRQDWMDLSSSGQNSGVAFNDSDSFSEISVRGALTYKVTDEISTYVSYVESVAPPTIGVKPERGEQYEIGVKYQPAGVNALISAAVYDLTKNDITVPVVLANGTIDRQLIGKARVRGFELEGKAELFDNFTVLGGYTYTDSEVVNSGLVRGVNVVGNQFGSTPKHMASLWANYVIPGDGRRGDVSLGLGARYIGSYYFTQQNDNGKSEATTLFDAAVSYQVAEHAQLGLNVSNIFDNHHVVGRGTADYYNPGRTVAATLRYTW